MEGELFRFILYVFFGFFMEMSFASWGIEIALGNKIKRRVPKKYLEGFISMYMIPIHGLGMLYGFEWMHGLIEDQHFILRYLVWAIGFTGVEALTGYIYHKTIGFYPWDYYRDSKYKVFKEGYTLWTLVPLWGVAGMILEVYSKLLIFISPQVSLYFNL